MTTRSAASRGSDSGQARDLAIRAHGVSKSFQVLHSQSNTLKEHLLNPGHVFGRDERRLVALSGVDFEVAAGEFFGIVGRNGSGKSTLLKLLASIYRLDSGRIEVAGRIAPFIELGVGFNMELTAHENVLLNGVMMGLSPAEARERFDEVIEFSELTDYTDLKLKNYSSGMQVRLAFALMLQARADILLIDEVLAVGDAAFQRKCGDALESLREEGKTIILVTHDMAAIQRHCDRAMLIEGGVVDVIGDPVEVADRYVETSYEEPDSSIAGESGSLKAKVNWIELRDMDDQPVRAAHMGQKLQVVTEIEAMEPVEDLVLYTEITTRTVIRVASMSKRGDALSHLEAGDRVEVRFEFESPLAIGEFMLRYLLSASSKLVQPTGQAFPFSVVEGQQGGTLVQIPYESRTAKLDNGSEAE